MKRQIGIFAAILLVALGVRAYGDYAATSGSGLTVFSFTCFTSKVCTTATLVNSAGAEAGVAAVPLQVSLANTAANGTAVKVDNSGVTQPVSGTVTANQGGTWTVTGAGGTFPIVTWGGGTLGAMANYGTSPGAVLVPGVNAFVTNTNANGQAAMASSSPVVIASNQSAVATAPAAGTNRIGYVSDDPCTQKTKTTAPFSTSSGGPVSIVALSGSTVVYVCSISAITDTAIKLSFIDGTGGSCASAQHAIWGSTTAANGMSLAANGGFTMGSGNGSVGVTAAASAFCLLQSGTSLVAGNITYVQQ